MHTSTPDQPYFIYIVQCADGTFYTGITQNIPERLQKHNGLKPGGAKYTRTRRPVTLQYTETHTSIKSALLRERAIKQFSRTQKQKLCIGINK